jgi:hypothetical protein
MLSHTRSSASSPDLGSRSTAARPGVCWRPGNSLVPRARGKAEPALPQTRFRLPKSSAMHRRTFAGREEEFRLHVCTEFPTVSEESVFLAEKPLPGEEENSMRCRFPDIGVC